MFFKNENKEVKRLNEVINQLTKEWNVKRDDFNKEIENLKKDYEIILSRKEAELDVRISEKTKVLNDRVTKLQIENGNYKKEVEILTKAFENLGFDVKDMKEILNKLVDGIVSKNTINLVK